jgi:hypothetical protein
MSTLDHVNAFVVEFWNAPMMIWTSGTIRKTTM